MLNPTPALAALDAADAAAVTYARTWHEALDIVLQLWEEARALNPDLGADWEHDVQADIRMARTLNARP
jgi:hypothetical protein